MRRVSSACPLDCPDLCSLTVAIDRVDGADEDPSSPSNAATQGLVERVVDIQGTDANPLTAGFICGKVSTFERHMYGSERVLYPMLREGAKGEGRFRRISWDQALDRVVAQIRETIAQHGGEAILPYRYGGSNGYLTHESLDARLFRRLGASQLLRTVCASTSGAAQAGMYGEMAGVALEDYAHAKVIVLWGVNPNATGIHLVPIIRAAQRQGSKLIVVDPRRIPMAKQADLHLQLKPGTDLPVALALIHRLFERGQADTAFLAQHTTGADELQRRASEWPIERAAEVAGIDPVLIERFGDMYAEASPAVIRCGWGQERNRNGGSATAAIFALPAVAGKFGVRGGGITHSNGESWRIPRDITAATPKPDTRSINMNQLGQVLNSPTGQAVSDHAELSPAGPPIKILFVYNSNALATTPHQEAVRTGLMREDLFTVVSDQVMTDTARYADLVLPATTFLEHRELRRGYGAQRMFDAPAVVAPVGEARPNYDLFAELLRRLDLVQPGDPMTPDELAATVIAHTGDPKAVAAALGQHKMADRPGGATPILFRDTFPTTPDGKIQLFSAALNREAPQGLYHYTPDPATKEYPLALISPTLGHTISSTFSQLIKGPVALELHPDDAQARGISDGDPVRVYNQYGEMHCPAKLSTALRPGLAFFPKGMWAKHTANGATANALTPDTLSDLSRGACFNDARVEVERRSV